MENTTLQTEVVKRWLQNDNYHDFKTIVSQFRDENGTVDDVALSRWLKSKAKDSSQTHYAVMYHGTGASVPVMEDGLKRTSAKTKKSLQSATGYVYLSCYPSSAEMFGDVAYPHDDAVVYAVYVPIRDLLCDRDQLINKRMWGSDDGITIKDTLAHSLIYGHGARTKSEILPYAIARYSIKEKIF